MDDVGGGISTGSNLELSPDNYDHELLQFHTKPKVADSFLSNNYEQFQTSTPREEDQQVWRFNLPRQDIPRYTDLSAIKCILHVEFVKRVYETDGITFVETSVADSERIAPISALLPLFWKRIRIWINGSLVYSSPSARWVATWLEATLFVSQDAQRSWGLIAGVDGDVMPTNTTVKDNDQFDERVVKYCTVKPEPKPTKVALVGDLPTDFQSMNRLLPQQCGVEIELTRASDEFLIYGGKDNETPTGTKYHLKVPACTLHAKKPLVKEVYFKAAQKAFAEGKPARLYFYENEVLRLAIPQNVSYFTSQNLGSKGNHPIKIFCVFSRESDISGGYNHNPLQMGPPDELLSAAITLDGVDPLGINDYYSNTRETGQDVIQYWKTLNTIQKDSNFQPSNLSLKGFTRYCYIISCDLTSTNSVSAGTLNMVRQGNVQVHFQFKETLKEQWVCQVWMISANLMTILPGGIPTISYPAGIAQAASVL